ncbi:MAG: LysM peptidoglycan-binding domain-containing protein [Patescibacteria group bacterium]
MATKNVNKTKKTAPKKDVFEEKKGGIFDFLRLGESYSSLVLGIIVVIIATVLLLSFIYNRNSVNTDSQLPQITGVTTPSAASPTITPSDVKATEVPTATIAPTATSVPTATIAPTMEIKPTAKPVKVQEKKQDKQAKTYTVKKGDDLWHIAEEVYNDGYKWAEIARVNNLSNPGIIHAGNKLQLFELKKTEMKQNEVKSDTKISVPQQEQIKGNTYNIKKGDTLWTISVRAYGDGYKWIGIAKANKLQANPGLIHVNNTLKIPRK